MCRVLWLSGWVTIKAILVIYALLKFNYKTEFDSRLFSITAALSVVIG